MSEIKKLRLSWNEYFMKLAEMAASRSSCVRRQVGSVAVDTARHLIGSGYNGTPSGATHCTEETCLRNVNHVKSGEQPELSRAIHSEQNLVAHCGRELRGSSVYVTNKPCTSCFKLLLAAGVTSIYWKDNYADVVSNELMKQWGTITITAEGYYCFTQRHANA